VRVDEEHEVADGDVIDPDSLEEMSLDAFIDGKIRPSHLDDDDDDV